MKIDLTSIGYGARRSSARATTLRPAGFAWRSQAPTLNTIVAKQRSMAQPRKAEV
jgi:hypothetical protein